MPAHVAIVILCTLGILAGHPAVGAADAAPSPPIPAQVVAADPLLAFAPAEREARFVGLFAPTVVRLPRGATILADAVAALAVGGNATALAAGIDPALRAQLAGGEMTYWQGVEAVCAAYGLAPVPGLPQGGIAEETPDGLSPVAYESGPVELQRPASGDDAQPVMANGPLLVRFLAFVVSQRRGDGAGGAAAGPAASGGPAAAGSGTRISATLTLRLEPRIDAARIGGGTVKWIACADFADHGLRLASTDERHVHGVSAPDRVLVRAAMPGRLEGGVVLRGEARIGAVAAYQASAVLRPGARATAPCAGTTIALALIGAGRDAQGHDGPGLAVEFHRRAFWSNPVVRLSQGGTRVPGSGESWNADGALVSVFHEFKDLPPGECLATIRGQVALGQVPVALSLRLALDRLPTAATAVPRMHVATRVAWPAGAHPLQRVVGLLNAGGNPVVLQLGVDERASVDLPAFDGTFWEAVQAVCRAYDLIVAPALDDEADGEGFDGVDPSQPGVQPVVFCGGAVNLVRRAGQGTPPTRPSGPLLVEVLDRTVISDRGLAGATRSCAVALRLRLEPRIDLTTVGRGALTWNSHAVSAIDPAQTPRVTPLVDGPSDPAPGPFARLGGRIDTPDPARVTVLIAGLPAGAAPCRISGQILIPLRRPLRATAAITPGTSVTAMLGRHPIALSALDAAGAEARDLAHPGLLIAWAGAELDRVSTQVHAPSGGEVAMADLDILDDSDDRHRELRVYPFTEPGAYTITLTGSEVMEQARVPIEAVVDLP